MALIKTCRDRKYNLVTARFEFLFLNLIQLFI